ncbi:MAG: DUF5678 domain-containing protein [Blastocatellia bacterium]
MSDVLAHQHHQIQVTRETIRQLIRQLPNEERSRVRSILEQELHADNGSSVAAMPVPVMAPDEFAARCDLERVWMEQNRDVYAGRWVALDGSRLVASGASAREVYATLKAAGVSGTLVTRVEHPDDLAIIE